MKPKPPQTDYLEHDEKAPEELAATFKTRGVLEPLFLSDSHLVRISGPLSTGGEGTASRGIAVGRKTGD
ncbi:MAG TPA: hypothetical protein VIH75_10150 [Candidatus Sulfotelmatobacter sp.]|jgi:hypothetical protein